MYAPAKLVSRHVKPSLKYRTFNDEANPLKAFQDKIDRKQDVLKNEIDLELGSIVYFVSNFLFLKI